MILAKPTIEYLYVHVPFCKLFCTYCDFYKTVKTSSRFSLYLKQLRAELKYLVNNCCQFNLKTIYFGGGTPSLLTTKEFKLLRILIFKYVKLQDHLEMTLECNPNDLSVLKIKTWLMAGVNRISIGIQTTDKSQLDYVNRPTNWKNFQTHIDYIKQNSQCTINFDFIYSLPKATSTTLQIDLNFIQDFKPHHLSCYGLIVKDKTALAAKGYQINQDHDETFFFQIKKTLSKAGYKQYEVSNWTQNKKHESLHNKAYWTNQYFIGIGPSAASYLPYNNNLCLKTNSKRIDYEFKDFTTLSQFDDYYQIIMLGLRLKKGINLNLSKNKVVYEYFLPAFQEINQNNSKPVFLIQKNHLVCRPWTMLDEFLVQLLIYYKKT